MWRSCWSSEFPGNNGDLRASSAVCMITAQHVNKVGVPNTVTYLKWTPIIEWCVVWCESKNRSQKDTCSKEIGLHVQNMRIILGLIVIWLGGSTWPLNENENLHFDIINKKSIWAPKLAMAMIWNFYPSCPNRVFDVWREVGSSKKVAILDPSTLEEIFILHSTLNMHLTTRESQSNYSATLEMRGIHKCLPKMHPTDHMSTGVE